MQIHSFFLVSQCKLGHYDKVLSGCKYPILCLLHENLQMLSFSLPLLVHLPKLYSTSERLVVFYKAYNENGIVLNKIFSELHFSFQVFFFLPLLVWKTRIQDSTLVQISANCYLRTQLQLVAIDMEAVVCCWVLSEWSTADPEHTTRRESFQWQ